MSNASIDAVITNITTLKNRGVEALLVPSILQLQERVSGCQVTVVTETYDYDVERLQAPHVRLIRNDFDSDDLKPPSVRRRVASLLGRRPYAGEAEQLISSASAVIASGGDVFSSDYGRLDWHLLPLVRAQRDEKPVAFSAQSIGPFASRAEADAWTSVARRSALITLRESLSYTYVRDSLGVPAALVHHVADPAFLLNPAPPDVVAALLKYYGIETGTPTIGLAISRGISEFGGVDEQDHFDAWRRVASMLLDQQPGVQLVLIPHVQSASTSNDDRTVATRLIASFQYDPRLRLIGADHSAAEFKGIISSCDMLIAERMHAVIAGISSGVCSVAIGYSVKAEGILSDVFGSELTRERYLIPVSEFVKGQDAIDKIQVAWQRREVTQERLERALPAVTARARLNFELLADLLR